MHMASSGSQPVASRSPGPPKFADMMAFVRRQGGVTERANDASSTAPNNDGAVPPKESPSLGTTPSDAPALAMIRAYFDQRVHELETRIVHEMDVKLKAMEYGLNVKLDAILKALATRSELNYADTRIPLD